MRGYLTVADVAGLAGCTEANVRLLAKNGRIPGAEKVGQQWVFDADIVEDWLPNRPKPGRPARRPS